MLAADAVITRTGTYEINSDPQEVHCHTCDSATTAKWIYLDS